MSNNKAKYLVLTSGGDAPGMNAALRAVVRSAINYDAEIWGVEGGYEGLIEQQLKQLNHRTVANCIQRGGTILKSARSERFFQKPIRQAAADYLNEQGFTGLIVLGGNGSFQGARLMQDQGGPTVIGIPCTIDNDIMGTDYCIGFDTACNTALQAIDKIRDTAMSFDNDFLIEVMGRSSGFIAVEVGIAGGAEIILIPEYPLSADEVVAKITKKSRKKVASIIVAAECDTPGWTVDLARQIKEKTGIHYRVCILGHTQRGGSPTAKDRTVATRMGHYAIEMLQNNCQSAMVSLHNDKISHTEFPDPENNTRYFSDKDQLKINNSISHD